MVTSTSSIRPRHSNRLKVCKLSVFTVILGCALSGCSNGFTEKQRVQQAIDTGLAKHPECRDVPVGVPATQREFEQSAVLAELKAEGLVAEGNFVVKSMWGKDETKAGYVFTDKGNALVATPARLEWPHRQPCFRAGIWKTTSVEAVDTAPSATGKLISNARTRIEFVPESWLANTRNKTEWADYWVQVQKQQDKQWMYHLLKSGDDFFLTGPGSALP